MEEGNKVKKYLKEKEGLVTRLGYLQRILKEYKVPVMILFEGVHASGKGRLANELLLALDPRYTRFYATHNPTETELRKPFFWQYFINTPSNTEFAIYYRSWYSLYIAMKNKMVENERYNGNKVLLKEIQAFEKTMKEDGAVLLKFYVEIKPEKQKERLQRMYDNPRTMWKAQEYDKANDKRYQKDMEEIVAEDDSWHKIPYELREKAINDVLRIVVAQLEERLKEEEKKRAETPPPNDGFFDGSFPDILTKYETSGDISKAEYKDRLEILQKEMRDIQYTLYEKKIPLLIVYEGWDAAGKGGNIKRLVQQLDPTGYEIHTTAAPTDIEIRHHYLWRFWQNIPKTGHIAIYDRSWYGRLMVERVEGFAKNKDVKRAYEEINDFEESLTNFGAIVIKFFIHISKEEQLKRFQERQEDENKLWKITDEDWRNREKWDQYVESISDMINKTDTGKAPWVIINGNNKRYARIKALETIRDLCYKEFLNVP
ncbi:phosphate--AMP phosphotransferase [Proteiniclasticum sp. BAD-10]|uniref:Phosphate--AMP phosphotransferase n=1 Tax=Proteiniclasticum sediminis TaxID=2804028 RepID=A0A941CLC1_9CLOT|nr:phosphate--AMP phosphotransferase [Proteiniclasticum sediminis]MBR0574756.1 phosphate--AMP phosphotransferase [Proteiniclasticum sediminis]